MPTIPTMTGTIPSNSQQQKVVNKASLTSSSQIGSKQLQKSFGREGES